MHITFATKECSYTGFKSLHIAGGPQKPDHVSKFVACVYDDVDR